MPEMRRHGAILELEIVLEHRQQMFLEAHHQRVHPGIEDHVGAFETHLRSVARRKILHMHRRGDHRAGNAQTLGNMPLHLRAQHQLGLQFRDLGLDLEIIVGDQRLDAVKRGGVANFAAEFAAVGAKPDHLEAELVRGDPCGGDGVGRIAEDEDALAGKVGRIDRARIPRQPCRRPASVAVGIDARKLCDFRDEFAGRRDADRNGLGRRLPEGALQPGRGLPGDLRIEHHVEIGIAQSARDRPASHPSAP